MNFLLDGLYNLGDVGSIKDRETVTKIIAKYQVVEIERQLRGKVITTYGHKRVKKKYIIVIKGVTKKDYEEIREDLTKQFNERNIPKPLFCLLPADYVEIEVVWLDEDMEKAMYSEALEQTIK